MQTNVSDPEFEETIRSVTLPKSVSELVAEYDTQIGIRDDYLWRWMARLLPAFQLPCVSADHADIANTQKLLLTMYITTVDDIVEYHGDDATFAQARKLPFPRQRPDGTDDDVDMETLVFATRVWEKLENRLVDAPRYAEFEDIFRFDIRQAITAMEYSMLVSMHPELANETSTGRYDCHNMVMFGYSDIDLMYAPSFDLSDLSELRSVLWKTQRLARIGNWLTTWERELHEGDYSSGVVVSAIQEGIIDAKALSEGLNPLGITRIADEIKRSDIEDELHEEWKQTYADLLETNYETKSIDLKTFVEGMGTVYQYHVNSKGSK